MTRSLVVDASYALKLILPGPRQAYLQQLALQWKRDRYRLCAPTLWLYEVTSALCKLVHSGELAPIEGRRALELAQHLGVHLILPDEIQIHSAFEWTMRLNRAAAYDSFYLSLAETLQCELWTADRRLYNAANLSWVHCVSLDSMP